MKEVRRLRSLLITMLLLITVVVVYQAVVEGTGGMKAHIAGAGKSMSEHIRSMDP